MVIYKMTFSTPPLSYRFEPLHAYNLASTPFLVPFAHFNHQFLFELIQMIFYPISVIKHVFVVPCLVFRVRLHSDRCFSVTHFSTRSSSKMYNILLAKVCSMVHLVELVIVPPIRLHCIIKHNDKPCIHFMYKTVMSSIHN